jgi:LAO/AO transport system kinase
MKTRVDDFEGLLAGIRTRNRRLVGRGLSVIENGAPEASALVRELYAETGRARVLGVTGPPGAGKSTLVDSIARALRQRGETVGILAVDPTSPYTGGALLGDRVRMQKLATDRGVFIRSMATRGTMGGLAPTTRDAIDLLDAAGFDHVLVETVGVGQDEVDVIRTVDLVVVVTVPGLGDEIQAIKAGIMEIADVFLVNKADRDGVERTVRDLRSAIEMAEDGRPPTPVMRAVASRDEGTQELLAQLDECHRELDRSGELEERRFLHLRLRVENLLKGRILEETRRALRFDEELRDAWSRREDPYSLSKRLFEVVVGR